MATRLQRRWIIGVSLFAVAIGCIAFSFGGSKEQPVYEGKSLPEWFDSLAPPAMYSKDDPDVRAIVAIGSDAVPLLMREFCISDSPWTEGFRKLWSRVGLARSPYCRARHRREKAYYCLFHLGSKADPALPELIKIAQDESHPGSFQAIGLLGSNRSNPAVVIPALQKMIADARAHGFHLAISALSAQGANACPALPRLREIEADPRIPIWERILAASASVSINPADRQSLEFIVAQWDHTNELREIIDVREVVASTLDGLGTNARPALPAIRRMMVQTESDPYVHAWLSNSIQLLEAASGAESSQPR